MSQTSAFLSAKSAALVALSKASATLKGLEAATLAATSPTETRALRDVSNALRAELGDAAEKLRYLDQCARRPAADPVRAAILRGDEEAIRLALLREVFEAADPETGDPDPDDLLAKVWPVWVREHGADRVEMPFYPGFGSWVRLRDRWLPLVRETLRSQVEHYREEADLLREKLAKYAPMAAQQLKGEAGFVVLGPDLLFDWKPGAIEAEIAEAERMEARVAVRAEAAAQARDFEEA